MYFFDAVHIWKECGANTARFLLKLTEPQPLFIILASMKLGITTAAAGYCCERSLHREWL